MAPAAALRIGYVPEHFSTPLYFAQTYFKLGAKLIPFPAGTGHMINALQSNEIDIGIGLTEGWIAGLGKAHTEARDAGYKLVGRYVETPLCWAISTGIEREELSDPKALKGKKVGVSRIGSGSYIMSFVLADQAGWLSERDTSPPFEAVALETFAKLRNAVNDSTADFFMWEHFTSKRYYDNDEIKKIGEIYTPWPSWHIVTKPELADNLGDNRLDEFLTRLDMGIEYFNNHHDEAVKYISTELDYSEADAKEWLKTVEFAKDVRGVKKSVILGTIDVLKKAGVLQDSLGQDAAMSMLQFGRKE